MSNKSDMLPHKVIIHPIIHVFLQTSVINPLTLFPVFVYVFFFPGSTTVKHSI